MAFSFVTAPASDAPLMDFRFAVFFLGGAVGLAHPLDFRFQEVSGLEANVERVAFDSLGQGDSSRRLPGRTTYKNLVLKRGMPTFSTFRQEVQQSLTSSRHIARNVLVSILDENALPLNSWLFSEAYPVHWSLSALNANSGQVIVEAMELTFTNFKPFAL